MGELASLGAALVWAIASIIFAGLGKSIRPTALNLLKCVPALGLMGLTLLVIGPTGAAVSRLEMTYLVISGVIGLTIGDTAYFAALMRLGARKSLLFMALIPFVTALMGALVLDEPVTVMTFAAMILTVGGVAWVVLDRTTASKDKESLGAGIAFVLVAVLCQAGGSILTKLGVGDLSSLEVSIIRLGSGSLGLLVAVSLRAQWSDVWLPFTDRRMLLRLSVALFLGTYIGVWLMNTGLKFTYAGIAATLTATSPIWVLPMAHYFSGDRMTTRSVVGALIAVAGIALLFIR
jgi:drug/metabolite transporter (DMT)-like permease